MTVQFPQRCEYLSIGEFWDTSPFLCSCRNGIQVMTEGTIGWVTSVLMTWHEVLWTFFWSYWMACGILVPQPGIELTPPALEVCRLHHWTAREVPGWQFLFSFLYWWENWGQRETVKVLQNSVASMSSFVFLLLICLSFSLHPDANRWFFKKDTWERGEKYNLEKQNQSTWEREKSFPNYIL